MHMDDGRYTDISKVISAFGKAWFLDFCCDFSLSIFSVWNTRLLPSKQWHETCNLPLKTYHNTFGGGMCRLRIPTPHLVHWRPVGVLQYNHFTMWHHYGSQVQAWILPADGLLHTPKENGLSNPLKWAPHRRAILTATRQFCWGSGYACVVTQQTRGGWARERRQSWNTMKRLPQERRERKKERIPVENFYP